MFSASLAFLIALAISAVMTPLVRDFAIRRGWTAKPRRDRDVHEKPIPRLGGLAIVVAFMVPLVGLLLVDSGVGHYFRGDPVWVKYIIGLFSGAAIITALGVYDDIHGANAYQKFAVQIVVACLMWALGIRIEKFGWFGMHIDIGLLSLPVTIIWIVGVINAMNLIDGLDGLASGVAFTAVLPNLILSFYGHKIVMMLAMASLGGAILGFLLYNFRPASVFMGDTGSMFLGFVLATASLLSSVKSSAAVSMIAPVLALGLPIMDTLLAVFRRSVEGLPLFDADRDHVHHRLLRGGMSHRKAVLVLYGASFLFAIAALGSAFANGRQMALLLLVLAISTGIFLRKLGYLSLSSSRSIRERNKHARTVARSVATELKDATSHARMWAALEPLRQALELAAIELCVAEDAFGWRRSSLDSRRSLAHLELPLGESGSLGVLRTTWKPGDVITRGDEVALALVADAAERAAVAIRDRRGADVIELRSDREIAQ